MIRQRIALIFLFLFVGVQTLSAQITDPFDPFDSFSDDSQQRSVEDDEKKSATELIQEAGSLLLEERPLDARSKLLIA